MAKRTVEGTDRERREYFFACLDYQLSAGHAPNEALARTVASYAYVYFPEQVDKRTPLQRASEEALKDLRANKGGD